MFILFPYLKLPSLNFSIKNRFTISNKDLDKSIKNRSVSHKNCFSKNLLPYGELQFEMQVDSSGSNQILVLKSSDLDKPVIKCLTQVLDKIKFPKFSGQKIARVYQLNLFKESNPK